MFLVLSNIEQDMFEGDMWLCVKCMMLLILEHFGTSTWCNLINPIKRLGKIMLFNDTNTLNNLHLTMYEIVTSCVLAKCHHLVRHAIIAN